MKKINKYIIEYPAIKDINLLSPRDALFLAEACEEVDDLPKDLAPILRKHRSMEVFVELRDPRYDFDYEHLQRIHSIYKKAKLI